MASKVEGGPADFATALGKLMTESDYREQVQKNPELLMKEFPNLSVAESGVLVTVWQACEGLLGGPAVAVEGRYCCCCCCWKNT